MPNKLGKFSKEKTAEIIDGYTKTIYNEEREVFESSLNNDKNFLRASMILYAKENGGVKFDGEKEDLVKWGLQFASDMDYSFTDISKQAYKLDDMSKVEQASLYYMFDTMDKKDITFDGTVRALKSIGTDPLTYVGILTAGSGFFGKQLGKKAVETGIKHKLRKNVENFISKPVVYGAGTGAVSETAYNYQKQSIQKNIDSDVQSQLGYEKDSIDKTQLATAGAIGGAVGGGLTFGIDKAIKGAKSLLGKKSNTPDTTDTTDTLQLEHKKTDTTDEATPEINKQPEYEQEDIQLLDAVKKSIDDENKVNENIATNTTSFISQKPIKLDVENLNPIDKDTVIDIDFTSIKDEVSLDKLETELVDRFKGKNLVLQDEVELLAEFVDTSSEDILSRLKNDPNFNLSVEQIKAQSEFLKQSAYKIKEYAEKNLKGTLDEAGKIDYMRHYNMFMVNKEIYTVSGSKSGKSLRSFGKGKDNTIMRLTDNLQDITTQNTLDNISIMIAQADTLSGVAKVIGGNKGAFRKGVDVVNEVFNAGILSAPVTQITNFVGGTLRALTDIADRYVGYFIPSSGGTDKIAKGEWRQQAVNYASNIKYGLHQGLQTFKTGKMYKGDSKLDDYKNAIIPENFGIDNTNTRMYKAINHIGNVIRFPTQRLMGGIDALSRSIVEKSTMSTIAYRMAENSTDFKTNRFIIKKIRKTTPDKKEQKQIIKNYKKITPETETEFFKNYFGKNMSLEKFFKEEYMQDLIKNPTKEMRSEATSLGKDVVFQRELGKTGKKFQDIIQNQAWGIFRLQMPFVKATTNMLKQAFLERTPLAFASEHYKKEIRAGGVRSQMARSKVLTGSLIGSGVALAGMQGTITGTGLGDIDLIKARESTGWRPKSILVNGNYISYEGLAPFDYIFGAFADIGDYANIMQYNELDDTSLENNRDLITTLLTTTYANLVETSFLENGLTFANMLQDPDRYGEAYIKNALNSIFIPYSGVRRTLAKNIDDTRMATADVGIREYITASTIGLMKNTPINRDIFGEEVKHTKILNPVSIQEDLKKDSVFKEIGRLSELKRDGIIDKPYRYISLGEVGSIKLEGKDYDNLQLLARKELVLGGLNYKEALRELMGSGFYKSLNDFDKIEQIKSITSNYDKIAREQIKNKSETVRKQTIEMQNLYVKRLNYRGIE